MKPVSADGRRPVHDPLLSRALSNLDAGGVCPDADVVGAWVEHALTGAEASRVEAHVSSCSRCQAVMAAMMRTAPDIPARRHAWSRLAGPWFLPAAAAAALAVYVATRPANGPVLESVESRAAESFEAPETPPEATPPQLPVEQSQSPPPTRQPAAPAPPPVESNASSGPAAAAPPLQAQERAATLGRLAPAGLAVQSGAGADRWRGSGAVIEYSPDGGDRWTMTSLMIEGLRAGSSPGAGVCWFVGAGAAVWVTVDGVGFSRLAFPEPLDLVNVVATTARDAAVTAADGRVFLTSDQGATWRPATGP